MMSLANAVEPVVQVRCRIEMASSIEILVKGEPSEADLINLADGQKYEVYPAIWPGLFVISVRIS